MRGWRGVDERHKGEAHVSRPLEGCGSEGLLDVRKAPNCRQESKGVKPWVNAGSSFCIALPLEPPHARCNSSTSKLAMHHTCKHFWLLRPKKKGTTTVSTAKERREKKIPKRICRVHRFFFPPRQRFIFLPLPTASHRNSARA